MISVGIDIGSTVEKAVIFRNCELIFTHQSCIASRPLDTIENVMKLLSEKIPKDEPVVIVATGYGRELIPNADYYVTEITCHGKGAKYLYPEATGVIDIGGQDCKAMRINKKGKVMEFLMNDKCAAGTGKFIEMTMHLFQKDIDALDSFLEVSTPVKMSSMCAVFAESEMITLISNGEKPENIAAGAVSSVCRRMANFASKIDLGDHLFFSGGLAQSEYIHEMMKETFKKEIVTHPLSQYTGAIGAAIVGFEKNE